MHILAFSFGFKDVIDILLVAFILYETYRLLRRTGAANLFWGILAFLIVWFLVSFVFQLDLTGALFDRIISVGAIALIVIFQEEIRMFFYRIGSRFSSWKLFVRNNPEEETASRQQILEITQACRHMASTKTGALIVIAGEESLKDIIVDREHLLQEHAAARRCIGHPRRTYGSRCLHLTGEQEPEYPAALWIASPCRTGYSRKNRYHNLHCRIGRDRSYIRRP